MSSHFETPEKSQAPSTPLFVSPSTFIPPDIDREILRSVLLFGNSENFKEISQRISSYDSCTPTQKRAIRDRRRSLLKHKQSSPERLENLRSQYELHSSVKKEAKPKNPVLPTPTNEEKMAMQSFNKGK